MKTVTKNSAKSTATVKRTPKAKKSTKKATVAKRNVAEPEAKDKAIKKRFVLCQFNPDTHKLVGTYLDLDHAANVTGMNVKDIQGDIEEGTETTGNVWIKSPVGKTVNHRIINKYAREKYKKIKTVNRGRRPIKREDALKKVQSINYDALDDASIKKLARIFASAEKRK